jgi:ankyrin repeat protein
MHECWRIFCLLLGQFVVFYLLRLQDGETALIWAAQNGRADCVRMLLQSGADKDAQDKVRALTICFAYDLKVGVFSTRHRTRI